MFRLMSGLLRRGGQVSAGRLIYRPCVEFLENRLAPADASFPTEGALEITRTLPAGNPMTWADPSTSADNTVPQDDRLEATLKVIFTLGPKEQSYVRDFPLHISQDMWFEEDDYSNFGFGADDLIGAQNVQFDVAQGYNQATIEKIFAPPSFVTTLRPNVQSPEPGDNAEFKGSVYHGFSDTDTGQIWLKPGEEQAGGAARGMRQASTGITYGTVAAARKSVSVHN